MAADISMLAPSRRQRPEQEVGRIRNVKEMTESQTVNDHICHWEVEFDSAQRKGFEELETKPDKRCWALRGSPESLC